MDEALTNKLQAVVDRQEIHEALMRYCRGIDRGDEQLVMSAFHPDGIDNHGTPRSAADFARNSALGTRQLMHFTGNVLIEFEGDTAFVESYFISFLPHELDGVAALRSRAGRYLDRFERRNGEWKIAYRMVSDEWARLDKCSELYEGDGIGANPGMRGTNDPIYHLRQLLK